MAAAFACPPQSPPINARKKNMDKTKQKSSYIKGALILTACSIFARFLGIFFKIPLARIIGDYGMGLYGYPYPIYSFFVSLSVIGLPLAISKMTSESMSLGRYDHTNQIFRISLVVLIAVGLLCSVLLIAFAKPLIHLLGWPEETYYSILGLSLTPLFVSYMAAYRGYFQGLQTMIPTALSQIVESAFRVVVGLVLAIYFLKTKDVAWAAGGAAFGAVAGAVGGSLLVTALYGYYKKKKTVIPRLRGEGYSERVQETIRTLFVIAIPASFASVVVSLMNMINSVTVARSLQNAGFDIVTATQIWGQLSQKVQTIINVPMLLGVGLAAALVPAISESLALQNQKELGEKTSLALRTVAIVTFPSAVGLFVLATPIVQLLFGATSGGGDLMLYLSFTAITTVIYIVLQAILQGLGKMGLPIRNLAIGGAIKLILNITLISNPSLHIYGLVIATYVAELVIIVLNYAGVKKYIPFKLDKKNSILKPALASLIMGAFAYASYHLLRSFTGNNVAVVTAIILGGVIYFAAILLTGALNKEEMRSLLRRRRG